MTELQLDYMVTKVLSRPPSEWMDLDPEEIAFIKSGIMWIWNECKREALFNVIGE